MFSVVVVFALFYFGLFYFNLFYLTEIDQAVSNMGKKQKRKNYS